jgi:hypothetical protein
MFDKSSQFILVVFHIHVFLFSMIITIQPMANALISANNRKFLKNHIKQLCVSSREAIKMGIYEELGVRRVVNCRSTTTVLGGGVMHPKVVKAMAEATGSAVPIRMLDVRCGKIIADICGAEAALLTTSATGGLALAAAGCAMRSTELAKYDPWKNPEGDNPDSGRIQMLIQRQLYKPSEI